ncbi:ADP/ATP-dependent (S)-NAD(P)H-hydrate dehydratase [uncultured Microbacterium sp.]|uniref:ADP-dependent NAD(P)H-hydrate dehydratase n=1 Tax=uncultured Microbacterium sp. TaxID=191216 RepID=UPI0025EA1C3F|nr:ADP/ATP-dependent (S)-NAD(P)H-hydrate dehydratase [uncultured Microbacterium sp.]
MSTPSPWTAPETATFLRVPTASDDKYSRGVVGMRTGSEEFPGAAVLGVEAAWRTGVGMVRYLGPRRAADLVLQRRPETVTAEGRVQAWVVGSGTSPTARTPAETAAVRTILSGDVPVVVDAGALDLVVAASAVTGDPAPLVLTPHDREHAALRDRLGLASAIGREQAALETAAVTGAVLLLKGSTTLIATPEGTVRSVTSGVAWLATAGTGDVLAGILGALVAGAPDRVADAAACAAWLHGSAGAAASARHGGGPLVALDVARAVSSIVGELVSER